MDEHSDILDFKPNYVATSCLDCTKTLQYALCSSLAFILREKWPYWLDENGLDITGLGDPKGLTNIDDVQADAIRNLCSCFKIEMHRHLQYPMESDGLRDVLTHSYARHAQGIGGQRIGNFSYGMYGLNGIASFVVASTFVRLLGAWEQFEVDALRCLVYHRPHGMVGPTCDNELIAIDEELHLRTFGSEISNEGIWSWMKTPAENRVERRKILSRIYGIDMKSLKKGDSKKVDGWYETRNRIAHGRGDANVLFATYIEADAFIFQQILRLSKQCKEKQLVWL
ncbi:hypothetical protein CA13_01950 [Planctomycetes bacterium CA13]|uniref:RiboL-PSP-HEPN domain-containing protein n=1 Tax=Novipirellula herctigrandis TaxID=2527986 RepID=A0A5C5YUW4_9BACT|nr:hypothetical protein CA13_01950 [Planctomycetes bacterium CA13]